MPCNMTLTQSYETQRDLLIGMSYKRGNTLVTQRIYSYDTLERPITRNTSRNGQTLNDSFSYNTRSELTDAHVNGISYSYNYDNNGNRSSAFENRTDVVNSTTYSTNELNQYTSVQKNEDAAFMPIFDADGNQTQIKTTTGVWLVQYNAENRPTRFTSADGNTVVECAYDSHGRRSFKKVVVNDVVILHQRYVYRGYLQIACCDLTRSNHDPQIMDIVMYVIHELQAEEEITCRCEGGHGHYSVEIRDDCVRISCADCGAKTDIPTDSIVSANAFLHCTHIDLQ